MKNEDDMASEIAPFPFLYRKRGSLASGEIKFETKCPINELLEMAITNKLPEMTAMGMIYLESHETYPKFSIKPTNKFHFERESAELGIWIEENLSAKSKMPRTIFLTQDVNEAKETLNKVQTL